MAIEQIRTYCTLCGVGCPSLISVEGGRVLKLEPDHAHPQGGVVCGKGRAAPEMHDHPHRVDFPVRRTRPKADPDPGWERISWDAALDLVAERLLAIRAESGPQAVAVGRGTGSGTGLSPTEPWVKRLAAAFGTPNYMTNTHLCNWARDGAGLYTFGTYPLPMPDVERSGCIVLWGSNPSATLLNLATGTIAATARGARLVVVDPRRVGLANRADVHLAVRPGTDAALALAFIRWLIAEGRFDDPFVRNWTNAPLLVRDDTDRLLQAADLPAGSVPSVASPSGASGREAPELVALDTARGLVGYAPTIGAYSVSTAGLALRGATEVRLRTGESVRCRPVLERLADAAEAWTPERAAEVTGAPADRIVAAIRLIAASRPVSHHTWNGIVQHTNASQAGRAIEVVYALLGDWDRPGGNVVPARPRTADIGGPPLTADQADLRLGRAERPLGPPSVAPGNIAAYDLYAAILEAEPYRVRGLLSFGGNTVMNTGDPVRGRAALASLEFFAQAELFHTPTSAFADVLLPAAGFLESEMLMITSGGVAQRRRRVTEPLHDRRPDVEIVFDLAVRLGLGERFAGGDVEAAYDEVLAPAGLTWAGLLDQPDGVRVAPEVRHEKHAELDAAGHPAGFATPTRKVELFVDAWAAHGQPAVPTYLEPAESPLSTPELARDYPLVLTNAKRPQYLHSQHRGIAAIRRTHPQPTIEIHPETAARYGVEHRSWVVVESLRGAARARADVTEAIMPGVVCANHGWWEACEQLGLPALDPYDRSGANVNLLVHNEVRDPISGGVPHRSSLCRIVPLDTEAAAEMAADARVAPGAPIA
jgi:anaerobic selenocysteine-containing dehydrogenase